MPGILDVEIALLQEEFDNWGPNFSVSEGFTLCGLPAIVIQDGHRTHTIELTDDNPEYIVRVARDTLRILGLGLS